MWCFGHDWAQTQYLGRGRAPCASEAGLEHERIAGAHRDCLATVLGDLGDAGKNDAKLPRITTDRAISARRDFPDAGRDLSVCRLVDIPIFADLFSLNLPLRSGRVNTMRLAEIFQRKLDERWFVR